MRTPWIGTLLAALMAAACAHAQVEDNGKLFAKFPNELKEAETIFARLATRSDIHAHVVALPPLPEALAAKLLEMDADQRSEFWRDRVDKAFAKLPKADRSALLLISARPGRVQLHMGKATALTKERQRQLQAEVLAVLKKDNTDFGGALAAFAKGLEKNVGEMPPGPGSALPKTPPAGAPPNPQTPPAPPLRTA